MSTLLKLIGNTILNKHLEFRVRLFNVLAMAGVLIGVLTSIMALVTNSGIQNLLVNVFSTILSIILLYYSYRSGRYQLCYIITITVIFIIVFPLLFFTAGGYHSGMPSFFVFAIAFTAFMLEGKSMFIMSAIEIIIYTGICIYSYIFPTSVNFFETEIDILIDIMMGFLSVSISLGITLFFHFRIYNEQQKQLEKAREEAIHYSEAKSAFLANMSHEIRTPINVILGMNEMILRESQSFEISGYALSIQSAGKTLLTLINNILDVSKIESGKIEIIEEPYETTELIKQLSVIGNERSERKAIKFSISADELLPSELYGDFIRIKQIIMNFLSNAIKYTNEGCVTLSFTQKPSGKEDEIIFCISVSDTGIGIKSENLNELFDAFTRVDLASNRNIEGTGLGLAIAKQLSEIMNGKIFVDSEWGKGSVFSLELPQKIINIEPFGNHSQISAMPAKFSNSSFIAPSAMILAVDDNSENLQVIKSLLSRTMLQIDLASSGAECIKAVQSKQYDVILMDYMMPDMDGIETLKKLKEIPNFNTPVISLTANAVAGVRQKLLDAGFCEYLTKPITWQDLESALENILPPELITKNTFSYNNDFITEEQKSLFEKELANYGITLNSGLRFLNDDIVQYKKLTEFFTDNYLSGKTRAEELSSEKDWNSLRYIVHSLKSKAKAVGATNLYESAQRLEIQCTQGNEEYIKVILPELFYEWKQAFDGLNNFIKSMDSIFITPEEISDSPFDKDRFLYFLKHNMQQDSLSELKKLVSENKDTNNKLQAIRLKIEDIEFRDAEREFLEYFGGNADGN